MNVNIIYYQWFKGKKSGHPLSLGKYTQPGRIIRGRGTRLNAFHLTTNHVLTSTHPNRFGEQINNRGSVHFKSLEVDEWRECSQNMNLGSDIRVFVSSRSREGFPKMKLGNCTAGLTTREYKIEFIILRTVIYW